MGIQTEDMVLSNHTKIALIYQNVLIIFARVNFIG